MNAAFKSLHPALKQWMAKKGWSRLRDIQQAAFLPIFEGKDAVLEAPTAGGKTEAVFFPLLTREASKGPGSVRILYLAPLRALLNNVELRAIEYSHVCGISAFKWHGDVDSKQKWGNFKIPSPVLLTTPESLEAILIGKPGWEKFFRDLTAVIIDEAHNFAAGDRGCHLVCLLERLEAGINKSPQRIALTATIGDPDRMLTWLAGKKRPPGRRIHATAKSKKDRDFRLKFYNSSQEDESTSPEKLAAVRLLRDLRDELPTNRSLIFVRSRRDTEAFAKAFAADARSLSGVALKIRTHHSAVSKFYREEAENLIKFRNHSGIDAIISTSTLELGIDIGELDKVFQVGCNPSPASFLQRVGRTGRRLGKAQYFRGLLQETDELVLMAGVLSLGLEGRSEALIFPNRAFHILVHQIICLARQSYGIRPNRAWAILKNADCFAGISREEFDRLIQHLLELTILRDVDGDVVVGEQGEKIFLGAGARRLFAVFETGPIYIVMEGNSEVGYLDSGFVEGLANAQPFYFVLAGILWKTTKVDLEHHRVVAKRSKGGDPPKWDSFGGIDVPLETAQEVGRILLSNGKLPFLDDSSSKALGTARHRLAGTGWLPGKVVIRANRNSSGELLTFAGDKINRTFAKFLVARGLVPANKLAARYDRIEFKSHKAKQPLRRTVQTAWQELGNALEQDVVASLVTVAPSKPFSRLTAQLPKEQLRAMYIDRATDVNGAINFARTSPLV